MDSEVILPFDGASDVADGDEEAADSDSDEPPNMEEVLARFRQEWQQELKDRDSDIGRGGVHRQVHRRDHREQEAKLLFLQGVHAEQRGSLDEAIHYYRRAVQLVPDIEFRIQFHTTRKRRQRQESESSVESGGSGEVDLEDLVYHFQTLQASETSICQPQYEQKNTHISALPVEVIMYIFKWVVSGDLDVNSLEQLGAVCRGFYLCARDEELWHQICLKIWGVNCGSRPGSYCTWHDMYQNRPHVRYTGCYISKASYFRQGEASLDQFYKPYHLVEYYRYVRFFADGKLFLHTTPDDPYQCIPRLRQRHSKIQGMLYGYFKVTGDKVTAVMKRQKVVDYNSNNYKYRRQRLQQNNNNNEGEQSFHVEFQLTNAGRRSCAQLMWRHYSIHTLYKATGEENIVEFELTNKNYPALIFSRVKSYTALSDTPLN